MYLPNTFCSIENRGQIYSDFKFDLINFLQKKGEEQRQALFATR
jgi:hypothetical protein